MRSFPRRDLLCPGEPLTWSSLSPLLLRSGCMPVFLYSICSCFLISPSHNLTIAQNFTGLRYSGALSVGFHSVQLTLLIFPVLVCPPTGTSVSTTGLCWILRALCPSAFLHSSHSSHSFPTPCWNIATQFCGTLRLQGFSVNLNRRVPKFFPLHEERENGFRAPVRKSWVLSSALLASTICFRTAFP